MGASDMRAAADLHISLIIHNISLISKTCAISVLGNGYFSKQIA